MWEVEDPLQNDVEVNDVEKQASLGQAELY